MFRIFGWSCVCSRGQTTFLVLYFRGSQISRFLRQKNREIKDLTFNLKCWSSFLDADLHQDPALTKICLKSDPCHNCSEYTKYMENSNHKKNNDKHVITTLYTRYVSTNRNNINWFY